MFGGSEADCGRLRTVVLVLLQCLQRLMGEREQCDQIEHGHQADADVAEIPHDGVGGESADEQHDERQNFVGGLPEPTVPEEVGHVGSGVKQDADERGEAEQREDDRDKDHAEASEVVFHRGLQQVHALEAGDRVLRSEQQEHGGTGADHDRVNEHAERLYEPDLHGMIRQGCRRGAGRRAGASLVGEKPSLYAVHQHGSEAASNCLAQSEGFFEDPGEDAGKLSEIEHDQKNRHEKIASCHNRHHHVEHLHGGIFPKHDNSGKHYENDGSADCRNMECVFEGGGNAVADHLADTAPADQAGEREKHGEHGPLFLSAKLLLGETMNIVRRAAAVASVQRILLLVDLRERGLDESGGGAEQGCDPHPEYSACAARGDGSDDSDQIPHADARGGRYHQSLEGGEAAFFALFLRQCADHIREKADGQKPCPKRKVDSGRNQKYHEQGQPQ